jgi:hypothetical protein
MHHLSLPKLPVWLELPALWLPVCWSEPARLAQRALH